jgi:hypothetical protein
MTLDTDRFADGELPVAGGVEHINLATRRHRVMCMLERATGRGEGARIAVGALRGDEDARLSLSGQVADSEREQRSQSR